MYLIRSMLGFALVVGVAGCIGDPGPVGTNGGTTGTFVLTVNDFQNGPTSGAATFQVERIGNDATLSISLNDSLGFAMLLSGPGAPTVGEDREIGDEEGLIGGFLTRRTAAGTETYELTGGRLHIRGASATVLLGDIEFSATQRTGPAVGTVVDGTGSFRATGGNIQM